MSVYNVGELLENPELLDKAAEEFAILCEKEMNKERESWDQGLDAISTPEQLIEIFDRIAKT